MPTAQLSAAVSAPACAAQRLMSGNRGARCPVYHDSRLAAPAAEAPSQVTTVLTLTANSPRGPRGVRYMLDGMPGKQGPGFSLPRFSAAFFLMGLVPGTRRYGCACAHDTQVVSV